VIKYKGCAVIFQINSENKNPNPCSSRGFPRGIPKGWANRPEGGAK